jgi:hypothetical protein
MKTFPGPGLVGFGSAYADIAARKANAKAASIFFFRKEGIVEDTLTAALSITRGTTMNTTILTY